MRIVQWQWNSFVPFVCLSASDAAVKNISSLIFLKRCDYVEKWHENLPKNNLYADIQFLVAEERQPMEIYNSLYMMALVILIRQ